MYCPVLECSIATSNTTKSCLLDQFLRMLNLPLCALNPRLEGAVGLSARLIKLKLIRLETIPVNTV